MIIGWPWHHSLLVSHRPWPGFLSVLCDFLLRSDSADLSHFWCHVVLLTALTRSSSGFSSQAPIICIGSWHGPSVAQPRVPLGWAEQSLGLIVFSFLFLSKVREIKFADPQVYLGFSEVCIIIFSNPLSSWRPHWRLPRSVNRLPLSYVVLLQLLINAWPPLFSSPCSIFQEKPLPPVGVVSEVVGCYG